MNQLNIGQSMEVSCRRSAGVSQQAHMLYLPSINQGNDICPFLTAMNLSGI